MSEPLDQVLARSLGGFIPRRPDRAPWHKPSQGTVEHAITDNRLAVPLECADRAHLRGLDHPTGERDDLEPGDWMAGPGWGMPPSA